MMRRPTNAKTLLLLAAAGLALSLTGCANPGRQVTEERTVSAVTTVVLAGAGNLQLHVGEPALTITAGENTMERITTEVNGERLTIGLRNGWRPGRIDYDLTLPEVSTVILSGSGRIAGAAPSGAEVAIQIAGSGEIEFAGLEVRTLAVEVSGSGSVELGEITAEAVAASIPGSGNITLSGSASEVSVSVFGSGSYRGQDLQSRTAAVVIAGSGSARVFASETLQANISGSGSVRYRGEPTVTANTPGSGSVRPD